MSRLQWAKRGENEQAARDDFWRIYETHYESIAIASRAAALEHPEFGPLVRQAPAQTPEQLQAEREMLRRAMSGDWEPYERSLREQSALVARMGISFAGWHEVARAFERLLAPKIVEEYGADAARLSGALGAMSEFVGYAMRVVGDSYVRAKEELFLEQRRIAEQRAEDLARTEAEVRRQRSVLAAILESMGEGVVVRDEAGNYLVYNHAARAILGDEERPTGNTGLEVFAGDGVTPLPGATVPVMRALRGDVVVDEPIVTRDPTTGRTTYLSVSARPLAYDGPRAAVVTFRDVTDSRRLEEATQRAQSLEAENRQIQEANRLKSEFLANMSHELRTPLNAIIGFAELMHDGKVGDVSEQHREFLGDILASGRHLLQLINDVLDLAKVEAGRMEFRPEALDLGAATHDACTALRGAAAAKRLTLSADVANDLPEAVIDPSRYRQVLFNYLSNAIKFTPEGGKVTVRVRRENGVGGMFRVEVDDTGCGIAPKDLARLFSEFQQLDGGTAKRHGGTGLGLALTRRIAEAQGGSVGARSELGRGSVFHAVLPLVCEPGSARRFVPGARSDAPVVLVVEDDPACQAIIVDALAASGYAVEAVSTGLQALARCRERAFAAVTLDLILPDISGAEVLQGIRGDERNRDVPVIVVSVAAGRGAVAGFAVHDLLPKPVEASALLSSLQRAGVAPERGGEVLVVDDDAGSLKLMDVTLAQLGYRATCHADAEAALRTAAVSAPVAVVLDLVMPGTDGFAFLDRFRLLPGHRRTPVIVWSVKDLSADEHARLQASVQSIVQKGRGGSAALLAELARVLPDRGETSAQRSES